jgi:hypothetical protein
MSDFVGWFKLLLVFYLQNSTAYKVFVLLVRSSDFLCFQNVKQQTSNQTQGIKNNFYSIRLLMNYVHEVMLYNVYHISRPIRRTFFPEKCDLNSTCALCAKGKYCFKTYKYPYIYYTSSLS